MLMSIACVDRDPCESFLLKPKGHAEMVLLLTGPGRAALMPQES